VYDTIGIDSLVASHDVTTLTRHILLPLELVIYCLDSLSTFYHALPDIVLVAAAINKMSALCVYFSELCASLRMLRVASCSFVDPSLYIVGRIFL
jgi:hypothetical protein